MNQDKLTKFRSLMEEALMDIAARTPAETRCLILSGGVDTCAILKACTKLGITFAHAITVACGDGEAYPVGPDHEFARAAAAEYRASTGAEFPHHVLRVTPKELIDDNLPGCVEELRTFTGMTLRNSFVVLHAFQKAQELGMKDVVVGDGADELMSGYSFTWGDAENPAAWKEKRDRMCSKWTFATPDLARMCGLKDHSPYTEPKVVDWVIRETQRSDCVGTREICLVYGGEKKEHITGKILLREAYETVSSYRRKDPIEVGSGVTVIGKDPFWKEIIPDEEYQAEFEALRTRGFVIQSKEHLYNFREFEKCFGHNGNRLTIRKRLELGEGCAGCCFELEPDQTFCHICGAYPAQRSMIAKT